MPLTHRTIFLAEDDLDDQDFLKEALLEIDPTIRLVSYSTGVKFISALLSTPDEGMPRLIVLDYNIPEMNGAEILQELGRHDRFDGIPKIVWSTSDSQSYRESCLASGAKAYLVKPSSVSGISAIAREMLTYF